MARSLEATNQLHKFIYEQWVYAHKSQKDIVTMIAETPELKAKFGDVNHGIISYHVNQIRLELESSLSPDAVERYTAEYVRFQHTIEDEITKVQHLIDLCDQEKEKEMWLKLTRLKKEFIETKLKALQDHELPLTVKKIKQQRIAQTNTLKMIPHIDNQQVEIVPETEPTELSDK